MDGGKRLRELIISRGFRYGAVAAAIGVAPNTITRWTDNAPIGKLFKIAEYMRIPPMEVFECFRPQPTQTNPEVTQEGTETERSTAIGE